MDKFTQGYIECALWLTEEPGDIAPDALKQMEEDCADFQKTNAELLDAARGMGWTDDYLGHDFFLTRNGHGAGFWDRGMGKVGDDLTSMAHPYGSCELYKGDDGLLYIGG